MIEDIAFLSPPNPHQALQCIPHYQRTPIGGGGVLEEPDTKSDTEYLIFFLKVIEVY